MNDEIRSLYETENMNEVEENFKSTKSKKGGRKRKNGKKCMKNVLKSVSKQMKLIREQQKLLNRAFETLVVSETKKVEQAEHGENMRKTVSAEKSFWGKLGDVVLKAVPTLLVTVVTSICGFLFKRKQGNDNFRQHWAMA